MLRVISFLMLLIISHVSNAVTVSAVGTPSYSYSYSSSLGVQGPSTNPSDVCIQYMTVFNGRYTEYTYTLSFTGFTTNCNYNMVSKSTGNVINTTTRTLIKSAVTVYSCDSGYFLSDSAGNSDSSGQYCTKNECADSAGLTQELWFPRNSVPTSGCYAGCTLTVGVAVNYDDTSVEMPYVYQTYKYTDKVCTGDMNYTDAATAEAANAAAQAAADLQKQRDACGAAGYTEGTFNGQTIITCKTTDTTTPGTSTDTGSGTDTSSGTDTTSSATGTTVGDAGNTSGTQTGTVGGGTGSLGGTGYGEGGSVSSGSGDTGSGTGTGDTGSGTGTGDTGSGTGTGDTGSGTGSGDTGSGTGTGDTGSGTGSGDTGSGTGSGDTGSGTGSGDTGSGTGSGDTGSGTGTGDTGSGTGTGSGDTGSGTGTGSGDGSGSGTGTGTDTDEESDDSGDYPSSDSSFDYADTKRESRTVTDVFKENYDKFKSTELVSSATGFFTVNLSGGACTVISVPFFAWSITFDPCAFLEYATALMRIAVLFACSFFAFRIAME